MSDIPYSVWAANEIEKLRATAERFREYIKENDARRAALEADARRYRWLREMPNADSLNVRYMGTDLDNVIDAAIDAAIEGENK